MNDESTTRQQASLYERLGGEQRIRKIVNELLDRDLKNPEIGHYLKNIDLDKLKQLVFEFLSMGTGGPHKYSGRDMRTAHARLGLSENDFRVSTEDIIITFEENGVGKAEIDEVVGILNSLKGEVLGK